MAGGKQLDRRDLILALIGMGIGAAGGALIHPLTNQKPRLGGYAASSVAGAAVGAPLVLLLAGLMKDNKNPVTDSIKAATNSLSGFFDSLGKGWNNQKYDPSVQKHKTDSQKFGQTAGNILRSLGLSTTDSGLLTGAKIAIPTATMFANRVWSPFDRLKPGTADALKSTLALRKQYIDTTLGSFKIKDPNISGASIANIQAKLSGRGAAPAQIGKHQIMTARQAHPSGRRMAGAGLISYLLASAADFGLNDKYKNVW